MSGEPAAFGFLEATLDEESVRCECVDKHGICGKLLFDETGDRCSYCVGHCLPVPSAAGVNPA
jgi:hypothetical protein